MPSPSVPPLKSVMDIPEIEETHRSPQSRSSHLADSSIKQWPKKLGEVIARKGGSSKKNPQLTEESLRAFNEENEDKRYAYSSPYYRGLTDFSLVISRQKDQVNHEQNYAPSIISSTSSKASFVSRVHEWGTSCFSPRGGERRSSSRSPRDKIPPEKFRDTLSGSSRTKESVSVTRMDDCIKTDPELDVIDIKPDTTSLESSGKRKFSITRPATPFRKADYTIALLNTQKPLREKESEAPQLVKPSLSPVLAQAPKPEPAPANKELQPLLLPHSLILTSSLTPAEKVTNKETCKTDSERIFLWADKCRPTYLKDFLCNSSKALELQDLARMRQCNHFIFEGSPGVGKRTMIWALLREIFDNTNLQASEEKKEFHLKGESVGSIFAKVKISKNHVEVNLSELRGYEKDVIVQLINEKVNNGLPESYDNCRVIILYGADKLSSDAMVYIKWLLERYKGQNKIFFCCSDASKLEPVKPICKVVQLLRPSIKEIVGVLQFIAAEEGINLPHQLAVTIANNSKNNLRQAIRSFEATWHFK
ncbi:hypothetical protein Leryth_023858 [Lithospermum erythrorhizon]|nr:hypothetical protein Leryth_023858 [Lithospermum erythrorhizon]